MGPPRGSFAERTGQAEVLPVLAQAGARHIADLTARANRWVAAGVSPLALETMLAAPPPAEEASALALVGGGPSRRDLPVRRDATRASLAAAVQAVGPGNVKRTVAEPRDNMLARSTRGPYESRLRTWNRLAFEGKVPAWPITTRTLEVIGAAFGAGAYRSAKEYFLAAFRYQEHDLHIEVDPLLRRFAKGVIKAIVRGLPGSRLKEAFPLPALAPLVDYADRAAFDPNRAAHSADVFVVAVWFMLREIEVAAARVGDMVVSPGLVVLDLPLHKTAAGGEKTLTRRSLRCACGAVRRARGDETFHSAGGGWPPGFSRAAVPRRGGRHPVQRRLPEIASGSPCRRGPGDCLPRLGRGGAADLRGTRLQPSYSCSADGRPGPLRDTPSRRHWHWRRRRPRPLWQGQGGAQLAVPLALAAGVGGRGTAGCPEPSTGTGARTGEGPEHYIYLARTKRVHKPEPGGAELRSGGMARHGLWRTPVLSAVGPATGGGILQAMLPGGPPGLGLQRGS